MHNPTPLPPAHWPSTHWTQLGVVAEGSETERAEALDRLVPRYRPALLAHLRCKFKLPQWPAEDVLQSFFAERIVAKNILALAARDRGRFRNFLLRSLDNFVLNYLRAERALQRLPPGGFTSWEEMDGWEPAVAGEHPSAAFEAAWALQVMEQARDRMREECWQSGREDIWEVFFGRILGPLLEQTEVLPYEALVARFGYRDPDQAGNILITGKRTFLRCLRAVVREYAGGESEVEEEIRDLVTILSRGSTTRT